MGSSPYPFTHTSTIRNASTWTCPSTLKPPPCTGQTITRTGSICLAPSSERGQSSKKTDERRNDEPTIEIGCETTSLRMQEEDQPTNQHLLKSHDRGGDHRCVGVLLHVSNRKKVGMLWSIPDRLGGRSVLLLFKRSGAVEHPGSSLRRR